MYQFQIDSYFTSAGHPERPNEDGFFVSPTQFLMIDGATGRAKGGRRFIKDSSYGTDAAWFTAEIIRQYPDFKRDEDDLRNHIRKFGRLLNQNFLKGADIPSDIEKAEVPCAAIHIAELHQTTGQLEIASLADTEAIIVFHDGSFEVLRADPRMDENDKLITAKVKAHTAAHGGTLYEAMIASMDFMRARASITNTPGNRGVMNVWDTQTAPDESFANHKIYNAKDIERIIMYSDGIDDRYGIWNHEDLIRQSREKSFENLVTQIREQEQADPLGISYPRIKAADDATVVCVTVKAA